ncbi:MAG: LVIVD repeat-containing protein [Gemmatimonadota bacterium]
MMKKRLSLLALVALVGCVEGGPVDPDSDVPIDGRVTIAWDGRTVDWGAPESLQATFEGAPAGSTIQWRSLDDVYRGRPVVLGQGASITTAALRPGITTVEATLMMGDTQISRDVAEIRVRYRESWNVALESQVQYPNGTVGDVWVHGGRAYVARRSAGGISIVGLDGAAVEIGRFTADSLFTQDVKAADGLAYVSHEPVPGFTGYPFSVTLVDVSDPAAPLVVAGVSVEVAPSAHNLWIDGDLLTAAAAATDFSLFDVSDPADPRLLSRIDPSPSTAHDAHVRNGLLFGSSMGSGSDPGRLTIASILQPSSPAVLGEITYPPLSFTHSSWLSADGRFLYVAEENVNAPIRIYDVTDPADPRQVGAYQPRLGTVPHNFQVRDGRFAYLSHYKHGIEVVDVSDPTRPRLVGFYDTPPGIDEEPTGLAPAHDREQDSFEGAWGVHWTDDGRIVASDMNRGLFVLRFTGPED